MTTRLLQRNFISQRNTNWFTILNAPPPQFHIQAQFEAVSPWKRLEPILSQWWANRVVLSAFSCLVTGAISAATVGRRALVIGRTSAVLCAVAQVLPKQSFFGRLLTAYDYNGQFRGKFCRRVMRTIIILLLPLVMKADKCLCLSRVWIGESVFNCPD